MPLRWPVALPVALVIASCGFADYETEACNPDVPSLDADSCNRLNVAQGLENAKVRYQCDRATARCALGPLDFDRDGAPDRRAGGDDCDDTDPRRAPGKAEVCDGIDNDCNGISDDLLVRADVSAPVPIASDTVAWQEATFDPTGDPTRASLHAVSVVRSGVVAIFVQSLPSPDVLGEPGSWVASAPSMNVFPTLGGVGVTYVRTKTCTTDVGYRVTRARVAYKNTAGGSIWMDGSDDDPCLATRVHAPTFAGFDGDSRGVVAYHDGDPTCGARKELHVQWIDAPTTAEPVVGSTYAPAVRLADDVSGLAAPAIAADLRAGVVAPGRILVAQRANGLALWSLNGTGAGPTRAAPWYAELTAGPFAAIHDAVRIAAATDPSGHIAVATVLGCTQDKLAVTVAVLGDGGATGDGRRIDVPTRGAISEVALGYVGGTRKELWLTFADAGGPALVRLAVDGARAEALLTGFGQGVVRLGLTAAGTVLAASAEQVSEITPGCRP